MATPPIIISNGGVAEELAVGLKPTDPNEKREAWKIILDNVDRLNQKATNNAADRPVARRLRQPDPARSPRIYWRLANENKHSDETDADAG